MSFNLSIFCKQSILLFFIRIIIKQRKLCNRKHINIGRKNQAAKCRRSCENLFIFRILSDKYTFFLENYWSYMLQINQHHNVTLHQALHTNSQFAHIEKKEKEIVREREMSALNNFIRGKKKNERNSCQCIVQHINWMFVLDWRLKKKKISSDRNSHKTAAKMPYIFDVYIVWWMLNEANQYKCGWIKVPSMLYEWWTDV